MRGKSLLLIPLLCLAALLAYSNSFRCDFTLDSKAHILRDPRIRTVQTDGLTRIFIQDYWFPEVVSGLYRPLTTLSFLFNYAVLGNAQHPAGYHWLNFALHCLNISLVYLLGLRIFRAAGPAFFTAALWGLHPVDTEAVTNIGGRADLLAAACVLGGLLCHIRGSDAIGRRRILWRSALGAIAAAGILSKESFAILPAVMLAYDLAFRDGPNWWARHTGYIAVLLPIIPFAVVRNDVRADLPFATVFPFVDNPLSGADFFTARLTAVKVIGKSLWLLAFPMDLSCDYSYNQIPLVRWPFQGWEDWKALLALAVLVALLFIAIRSRRRARPAFFFIAFFFVTLLPTSNLIVRIGSIMADRFLYLPAIGFAACLVMLATAVFSQRAAPAILAILCLGLACRTWARNRDWLTEYTIWTSATKVSPASFHTHRALASVLMIDGNTPAAVDQAAREMDRCLAILDGLPDNRNAAIAYAQAGMIYRTKGWYQRSLDTLLRAAAIDRATNAGNPGGGLPDLYVELAITYRHLAQPAKAVEALRHAQALDPYRPQVYSELADTYIAMADPPHAAIALLEGLRMVPYQADFVARLTALYRQMDPACQIFVPELNSLPLNRRCDLLHRHVCESRKNLAQLFATLDQKGIAAAIVNEAASQLGCPSN